MSKLSNHFSLAYFTPFIRKKRPMITLHQCVCPPICLSHYITLLSLVSLGMRMMKGQLTFVLIRFNILSSITPTLQPCTLLRWEKQTIKYKTFTLSVVIILKRMATLLSYFYRIQSNNMAALKSTFSFQIL